MGENVVFDQYIWWVGPSISNWSTGNEHIDGDDSIFVTKVIPGGAASNNGKLRAGDKLIAVDGEPLEDCS